ncbi:MAG TPA: amino acid adenylation domain-containing protein [Mycobacterium sp.]|uniref:non-ribosomal peptide synthetase n=1 Tax=Mycobacterium sp. TaxID=1785 RepID=UPI002CC1C7B1|nr:non-ribosomal peptide synthetase [Mycobacterium sp.]HXO80443.1 amino acid adenylation domain-containing protein [Mycobacterium sp.]
MLDVDIAQNIRIDRVAADAPGERPAVLSEDGTLCYAEFDSAVNHIAEVLRAKGVERDECVGVIVPRSPQMVVAIHGILRAGAAYVPIDPGYPEARVHTIIEDSGARIIVAGTEFAEIADDLGVDRVEPSIVAADPVEPLASPEDLAYVIYTSGSTGRPKGVMVEHRSVVNRLHWMQRRYPIGSDDVILQKTSVTFDVSVWELLWWAMTGASVALLEPGGERDPRKIIAAVGRHRVTVMHFVPTMLCAFLDELEDQPDSVDRLKSLHTVFCSGEALTPALVERFNRVFATTAVPRLVNLYGPTEATVDVSYFDCPQAGPVDGVPIGKPIDNTRLLVLDERGNRCPVGVPGELNIAGVGLARGYRGRDDLTAAVFVADERVPGGRRYRTGDLARWRADGNLEFLGRADDEVKVRGNRVSPGEVQAVAESCPGVRSAVVIAEPSEIHGNHLIGYFIGESVSPERLREHLAQLLPAYMIPTSFVQLNAFPLTTSGKVDRRALPRPGAPDRSATAPRTPAEAVLADVFASVLKVETVGIYDNFFSVGGDSILALAVRSEAEKRGIAFDVDELFVRPTVAELAETSSRPASEPPGVTDAFATLAPSDRAALCDAEDAFPATVLQLGMLFHSIERAESTMYKDVFRYRLAMPWREREFTDAFDRLVARHPALRSSFDLSQYSVPLQVVWPRVPRAFDAVTGADDLLVWDYLTARHAHTYDLDRAPLYGLRAFVRDDGVDLVFAFHHAILDGWSVANLIRELLQDYLFRLGLDVPAVDAEVRSATILAEHARLERAALDDPVAQEFWRSVLAGSHLTSLGSCVVHEARAPVDSVAAVPIPQWLQDAVGQFAKSRGLPMKSLLLAAHCVTLQRLSGEEDVTTGLVTHGRPGRAGAEEAAGLFLNMIPIRVDHTPATWLGTVEQVDRFERASHRYRRYPLQAMQSDAGRPLLNTAFNYVNYHPFAELFDIAAIELLDFEAHEQTNFALLATVAVDPRTRGLFLFVNGDPHAVTAAQTNEYANTFVRALVAIVRSPEEFIDLGTDDVPARDVTQLGSESAAINPDVGMPPAADRPAAAGHTAAESVLVDVFASVLGLDSVGVHDNFFTVGGDSILALVVRSKAEKRGIAFDLDDLYARPTIAELAEASPRPAAKPQGVTDAFGLLPLIDRAALCDAEDAFPATVLQLGMLFHSIERAESTMYKDVFRYRLAMPWREREFTAAFDRLVARHPALRSSFELNQHSTPVQVVRPGVPRAFDIVTGARDADVEGYIASRHTHRYDFNSAPLYGLRAFVRDEGVDLVFAFHHAILDGWSVANLIRELLQDYLFRLGLDVPAVDAGVHSATILAEHARLERAALEDPAAQEFWRSVMKGSRATALGSYVAHQPPATADPIATILIPPWLQDAAGRFAKSHGLPVKSLLLAAHCVTLQRLSGEADVTTGLVTHGRPDRDGAEVAAGLFLNTIPVRLDDTPATWVDAVERVARFERASHRYRRYPLQAMQSDAGRPLFNVVFNFINYHLFGDPTSAGGIELLAFEVQEQTNFAMWVTAAMDPRTGRLSLRVTGNPAVLTAIQAREYGRSLVRVLAAIVRSPEQAMDSVADELAARDVAQLVSEQAAATPDATALVTDTASWTYAELDRGAERIAAGLLAAGMPPGARVGVMLERSPELIATVLGVLKAGAAVVPMDVSYPRARIELMIERARPFRVMSDIAEVRALMEVPATMTLPVIDPESAAYVLFTSGSTGEPKGVTMPHRALHNLIAWQNRRPSSGAAGSTLQFFPLSFDVSFQEVFSTLCGGGTLRLVSDKQRRDLRALVRLVADEGIERVFLTCVALQAFADAALVTRTRLESLRVVINVGEQLRVTPEIRELCTANPGLVLENHYGPTETHEVASYTMSGAPEDFPTLPPIGTAIDGATIRLLDANLRPVPHGTRGEIYVGGRCLAIGYEARPDLTAERFVTVGGVGESRERMYRTGDLGVQLPSGDLVYLGRADDQVKVRGFRIECAEIELALMNLNDTAIQAVAVVARNLDSVDSVLVAYLVGDSEGADLAAIRAHLRAVLPAYMIPAHFQWLDEFPLTPSGKRDDKALRELPLAAAVAPSAGATPFSPYERAVADIMAEFAVSAGFAADTNFFDAGGTSIGAMRVVMAIARRWDVEIPLDAFVAAPTAAHIASLIAAGGSVRAFDPVVALRTSGDRPPLFLVHPIGGNVLCYLNLVKHLPVDQPVYALQAAGAEPGATPLHTMSDLAVSYIAAIRRVRPHGPFHIGGWSFGGYVAVEIARQLADEELARLILLDTTALGDGPHPVVPESELITWFFGELLLEAHGMEAARLTFEFNGTGRDASFDSTLRNAIEAGIVPAESSPQLIRRLYEIFRANYEATLNYRHEPLDRDITLLRSAEDLPAELAGPHRLVGSMFASPTNGWEILTPRSLRVIEVAGDHLSMMSEPHVADVAAKLSTELAAVALVGEGRR